MLNLTIDPAAGQPPFEQLRGQLIDQITHRQLPAGTKLPAVRRLAADLGLAPNTVARTYRELEAEGYLITQGRNGTTVAPVAAASEEFAQRAANITADYVNSMRALGFGDEAIVLAVRRAAVPD